MAYEFETKKLLMNKGLSLEETSDVDHKMSDNCPEEPRV